MIPRHLPAVPMVIPEIFIASCANLMILCFGEEACNDRTIAKIS
jgi:hypothetical protein